mmetsp:Transcript_19714/g.38906  ORF Transcript_19714/g.38906 Transcript_19714/m.38906 type:complete len:274 (+) Transcript_19714:266-1087(+)
MTMVNKNYSLIPAVAAFLAIGVVHCENVHITCGSAIKLRHVQSKKYFLKSNANQQYGAGSGGSGQQVVTLSTARGDPDAFWQIRESHVDTITNTTCRNGTPIQCGSTIRLTHVGSNKNLHSHDQYLAPLSQAHGNNEVSGFGDEGVGDESDDWIVDCVNVVKKEKEKEKGKAKSSDPSRGSDVNQSSSVIDTRNNDDGNDDAHEKYWNKKTLIRLRHSITHRWLSASSKFKYTDANCPHCPILGDVEVSARSRVDDSCVWRVAEDGAFFGVTV